MSTNNDNVIPRYSTYSVPRQFVAAFSGILIIVSNGMHHGWSSPSLPLLLSENSEIHITKSDGSWLSVMPILGMPIGCLIVPLLTYRFGRKTCILLTSPVSFATWLIIAYAPSVTYLDCARFVAGIGDGIALPSVVTYLGEISDKKIRGTLCCTVQVAFKLGLLIINVLGVKFNIKTTALLASTLPVVHFATFIWMPESPYFQQQRNKDSDVVMSLNAPDGTHESELQNAFYSTYLSTVKRLFANKIDRKPLFIMLTLVLVEHCSGFFVIAYYALTIFNESGGALDASTTTFIYFGVQLISSVVGGVLIDKMGRRPMLIFSVIVCSFALTAEGIYFYLKNETDKDLSKFSFVPLTALLLYTIMFGTGLGPVTRIMGSEIFPLRNKTVAVSIVTIMISITVTVMSKLFQIVKDSYGMHVPFYIFAICCVLGLPFIVYFVPETKGKTLEEIQEELTYSNSKYTKY